VENSLHLPIGAGNSGDKYRSNFTKMQKSADKITQAKLRLDQLLVERGFAENIEQARRLIMAGNVLVEHAVYDKPGKQVPRTATVQVRQPSTYVSRGGHKLAAALDQFHLDVRGLVAVDVGASTGGFTDCLLQRGASRVYAIDVGYGQLAWKLRNDPRVVTLERTNIRHLTHLPANTLADLAVIDASFIGLALILPATLPLLEPTAQIIALVKPQFEAHREQVEQGGVVRAVETHRQVLEETTSLAAHLNLTVAGLTVSPAPGPAGNVEFLLWLTRSPVKPIDLDSAIQHALQAAARLVDDKGTRRHGDKGTG
jgi:23S rRNA (cytidine1920-2'-O)/16S rRNA (cytidine1409-2'-O)-methyltransferase